MTFFSDSPICRNGGSKLVWMHRKHAGRSNGNTFETVKFAASRACSLGHHGALLRMVAGSFPLLSALGIYQLAILAGAASVVPGGVGSTEVTIVALLSLFEVPLGIATLAAVEIRFASIWFAMLCGFIAMCVLEFVFYKTVKAPYLREELS